MASIADIHVLIVDDSRQMRQIVRGMLIAGGIRQIAEADCAEDGFKALRAPTNLVIVDWQMVPTDGLTFTRMVRQHPESPRPFVPIIMLTAHTEISRVAAARDAGVNGFVKKPVSAQMLFARMGNALTDSRLFVQCASFVGPDRRRLQMASYRGPLRRESDARSKLDTFDLDDLPMSA